MRDSRIGFRWRQGQQWLCLHLFISQRTLQSHWSHNFTSELAVFLIDRETAACEDVFGGGDAKDEGEFWPNYRSGFGSCRVFCNLSGK